MYVYMTYLLTNIMNVTDEKVTGKPPALSVDVANASSQKDSKSSESVSNECAMDPHQVTRSNTCEEDTEEGW